MKNRNWIAPALAALLAASVPFGASAKDGGDLLVRLRGIGVIPNESGTTTIGGDIDIDNDYVPELDFTYFFTKNIAAELILATTRHQVQATGTAIGDVDLGHVRVLPPILTAQYHFFPDGKISPYLGAGVNYTIFYGTDRSNNPAVRNVDYDNRFGWALQAGMDWQVYERWSVNFDIKKLFVSASVSVNDGAVKSRNADIDPWIVGVGIGYRFSL